MTDREGKRHVLSLMGIPTPGIMDPFAALGLESWYDPLSPPAAHPGSAPPSPAMLNLSPGWVALQETSGP